MCKTTPGFKKKCHRAEELLCVKRQFSCQCLSGLRVTVTGELDEERIAGGRHGVGCSRLAPLRGEPRCSRPPASRCSRPELCLGFHARLAWWPSVRGPPLAHDPYAVVRRSGRTGSATREPPRGTCGRAPTQPIRTSYSTRSSPPGRRRGGGGAKMAPRRPHPRVVGTQGATTEKLPAARRGLVCCGSRQPALREGKPYEVTNTQQGLLGGLVSPPRESWRTARPSSRGDTTSGRPGTGGSLRSPVYIRRGALHCERPDCHRSASRGTARPTTLSPTVWNPYVAAIRPEGAIFLGGACRWACWCGRGVTATVYPASWDGLAHRLWCIVPMARVDLGPELFG